MISKRQYESLKAQRAAAKLKKKNCMSEIEQLRAELAAKEKEALELAEDADMFDGPIKPLLDEYERVNNR